MFIRCVPSCCSSTRFELAQGGLPPVPCESQTPDTTLVGNDRSLCCPHGYLLSQEPKGKTKSRKMPAICAVSETGHAVWTLNEGDMTGAIKCVKGCTLETATSDCSPAEACDDVTGMCVPKSCPVESANAANGKVDKECHQKVAVAGCRGVFQCDRGFVYKFAGVQIRNICTYPYSTIRRTSSCRTRSE